MPGHPRLYRRGATYYHRAAIPLDIKDSYPKTEETFSLGTKDHAEAVKLVRVKAAEVDRRFDDHRRQLEQQTHPALKELTDEQIKHVGKVYFTHLLEEDEELRLEGFSDEPRATILVEEGQDVNALIAEFGFRKRSFDDRAEEVEWLDKVTRENYARGKTDQFYDDEAREVLTWVGLQLAPASSSWRKVSRELQAASIRATEAIKARNRGDVVDTPKTSEPEGETPTPLLSAAVEEWAAEKARTSWVPKTEHEHRTWMGHFTTVAGDKPLAEYTKADGRAFKAMLLKLPANWSKQESIKNLPVDKAANRARELGLTPMSESNVNKLLGFVSSFWTWAGDHFDNLTGNPFRGLKIKLRKRVQDDRDPFSLEELKAIFNSPLYTGCKSVRHWKEPGDLVPRDAGIFWVPLIGLFTGARLGEIIQLYVDDVREEEGVVHFNFNIEGEDKRLKNPNSRRSTPVHQTLVDLGLLSHVETRRRSGETRLFPDLKMGADGYYSSPFSKHFNERFLPSIGVKRGKNAFHSFRHSFEDAARDSDISKELRDALVGHGEEGMSKRYGRGHYLRKLDEAMASLRYRDLDLEFLYERAG